MTNVESQSNSYFIRNTDMTQKLQQDIINCTEYAFSKHSIEDDIAKFIKSELDIKYLPSWQCIVGRSFGSYIGYEMKHFMYFLRGEVAVLIWKA